VGGKGTVGRIGDRHAHNRRPGRWIGFIATEDTRLSLEIRGIHFDLVLLGDSIPAENRERLTFLIRAFGSHVPVVSIANSSAACDVFADATLRSDSSELLKGMGELMAKRSSMPVAQTMAYSNAA
jgi:hypothetical protein